MKTELVELVYEEILKILEYRFSDYGETGLVPTIKKSLSELDAEGDARRIAEHIVITMRMPPEVPVPNWFRQCCANESLAYLMIIKAIDGMPDQENYEYFIRTRCRLGPRCPKDALGDMEGRAG